MIKPEINISEISVILNCMSFRALKQNMPVCAPIMDIGIAIIRIFMDCRVYAPATARQIQVIDSTVRL